MGDKFMLDKTGRKILPGDVLKVFHFIGARRKRHYLYKQALRYERGRLVISHLNRVDDAEPWVIGTNFYTEAADNVPRQEYEVVQCSAAADHNAAEAA